MKSLLTKFGLVFLWLGAAAITACSPVEQPVGSGTDPNALVSDDEVDGSALPGLGSSRQPTPAPTVTPAPHPTVTPEPCAPLEVLSDSFEVGSFVVNDSTSEMLQSLALQVGMQRVQIVGHTDNIPVDIGNQTLSELRASAVAAVLTDAGVPSSQIVTSGRGESDSVTSNATPYGRAQNRRVEILVDC